MLHSDLRHECYLVDQLVKPFRVHELGQHQQTSQVFVADTGSIHYGRASLGQNPARYTHIGLMWSATYAWLQVLGIGLKCLTLQVDACQVCALHQRPIL